MTVSPIVAGVFQHEDAALRALQALREAGFNRDQVGYAVQSQGQAVNLFSNLQNLGVVHERASYYDREFRDGHPVISVRADGREEEAHDILHRYGSYDYEHQTGFSQPTTADQGMNINTASQATVQGTDVNPAAIDERDVFSQPRTLRLREEQLNVSKERVQSGEVGLHKEIVTEQKIIDVPVSHEEVYIERRPIARGQIDTNPIGEDEIIRIPVSEEQVNIEKRTVASGEVVLGKRTVEETQQVRDTLKREEVRVERQGNPLVRENEIISERDDEGRLH
ncbi:MAG: YsnF/AvaK domain-containing protein [Ktedonobacteraceae bacterium]